MRAAQQQISASRAPSGAFGEAVAANIRTQGGGSQDTLQGVFVVHRNPAKAPHCIQLLCSGYGHSSRYNLSDKCLNSPHSDGLHLQ